MKTPKPLIRSSNQFPVVGIGASAGGLDAFKKLLTAISESSGMAYILVQHLDPSHESLLPNLLQKVTPIPVVEITDNIKVAPNHIYIIPSNKILIANDGVLQLKSRPSSSGKERSLPIDLFFASLAEVHQSYAIGVVLSGSASDGTLGLKAIKEQGGITFAQDESSAAYNGMPGNAISAGVVDFILPPEKIPGKLLEVTNSINRSLPDEQGTSQLNEDAFKQILSLLRIRKGIDFTYYKQTTIRRRILRRMALNKKEDPLDYLKYLREVKSEQDVLYQDLLIPVTSFFRDPKNFDQLGESVFPHLVKHKRDNEPIRVWVAGCSTGEEAYSIAICLKEYLGDRPERVQIFATDLSEPAIAKARAAIYGKNELGGLSPHRLQEFFIKTHGAYQVSKQIRDLCVFAVHNFLKDPPFGKMDFISCRNVLIYMEPYLQKKALTTFHYALNPNGVLLLGKSETGNNVPELFSAPNKSDKFFFRKEVPGRSLQLAVQQGEQVLPVVEARQQNGNIRTDFQKTADDIILSKYTPPGVVVNESMDIVHFRGSTGAYLEQLPGKPTHNLLKLAKNGLGFELRNILHKAKKDRVPVIKENIAVQSNDSQRIISIEAIPLPNIVEPHYLVLFHERSIKPHPKTSSRLKEGNKDLRIQQLESELVQLREDMRGITEAQEAANEELQSVNEELMSGSEELQSLNEELETSKEELQSTIEELTVVNQELITLNEQFAEEKEYAEAIISTTRQPLMILDKDLRVISANRSFYKTFLVNEQEVEGKVIYEVGNHQWDIPELRSLLESILPKKESFNDFEVTHNFQNIGLRTMLLNALEILRVSGSQKLILLAFDDITEKKQTDLVLRQSEAHFRLMADLMPQKVWTADAEGNRNYFNQKWLDYTGLIFEELKDWGWKKVIHPDDWKETKKRWLLSIKTGKDYEIENRLCNEEGKYLWHLSRGIAVRDEQGKIKMWIGSNTEIQHQKNQKEKLEKAVAVRTYELQQANEGLREKNQALHDVNKRLEAFTYVSSHDMQEPLRKIQTFISRIEEKEVNSLSGKGKDYFERIKKSANRMQILIQDLLIYSRASPGDQKMQDTDLNGVLSNVLDEFKETIWQNKAIVQSGELCRVRVIPFQLQQLLHNIIGNALKFARPDNIPHISIKSKIATGDELQYEKLLPKQRYCNITIADNGIGFDPVYNTKVFELFQRLHGSEMYPGTGIGLAIVKKIVENHNGFIKASGILNEGTTFDIYLPAS